MRSVNKVILVGNITRDPEIKNTGSGQSIVTFGLATNREWITANGEKQSLAEYHNIVGWGKLAEICHQYLKKGRLIYIEGYLKTRSWDSPEGAKIFKTEIVMQDMIMLEKKSKDDEERSNLDLSDNNVFDPSYGLFSESGSVANNDVEASKKMI